MAMNREILEELDPNWHQHFDSVWSASEHYRKYMPISWAEAQRAWKRDHEASDEESE